jgi:DNA recombination-dependent growth factor C
MGLLNARLTARRFRVAGELQDGFRETYRDRLGEFAFREPPHVTKAEVEGWTQISDVTATDFSDFNTWLIDSWVCIGLRLDKRVLPARVFRATLKARMAAWAEERGVARVPASVRAELKERLEEEWLRKVMPRTNHYEVIWNISSNMLYVSNHGDATCDRIRKRFYQTFGRRLIPFSPLEWIKDDAQLVSDLLAEAPTPVGRVSDVD